MNTTALRRIAACALAMSLCDARADALLAPLTAAAGSEPAAPWHVVGLPQQTKPFTQFTAVDLDGHRAMRMEADQSYGNLVHELAPLHVPAHLAWQWRIERPLAHADLHHESGDDSAVKVCVFFDEPMDAIPFTERQFLHIAHARTSEPVPPATICYVWDASVVAGTEIDNAFTRRVRYIVVESGPVQPARWVSERRDLGADFLQAYGGEVSTVPPIIGIAVGADADNTRGHSVAYVSDLKLDH